MKKEIIKNKEVIVTRREVFKLWQDIVNEISKNEIDRLKLIGMTSRYGEMQYILSIKDFERNFNQ